MAAVDVNDLDFDFKTSDGFEDNSFGTEVKERTYPESSDFIKDPFENQDFDLLKNSDALLDFNEESTNEILNTYSEDKSNAQNINILKYDEIFGDDPFMDDAKAKFQSQIMQDHNGAFPALIANEPQALFANTDEVTPCPTVNNETVKEENNEQPMDNLFTDLFTDVKMEDEKTSNIGIMNHVNKPLPDLALSEGLPNASVGADHINRVPVAVSISDVPIQLEESVNPTALSVSDVNFTVNQKTDDPFIDNQKFDDPFTDNQKNEYFFTDNQKNDDPFTDNQKNDDPFTDNQKNDDPFTINQKNDDPFTDNQKNDDPFTINQKNDDPITDNQKIDDPFISIISQTKTDQKDTSDDAAEAIDLSKITSSLKDQAQDFDSEFDFDAPVPQKNHTQAADITTNTPTPNVDPAQTNKDVSNVEHHIKSSEIKLENDKFVPDVTAQSNNIPGQDEKSLVCSSAEADWENIETIQPGFQGETPAETQVRKSGPLYTYKEAYSTLQQADYTAVQHIIKPTVERNGLSAFVHFVFGPPKLHRDMVKDREFAFCLSASSFDEAQPSHGRMLQTIYRLLTGSRFDSPRFGSHWEEIGFQGRDPSTDLRGVGVLGLVQLLYFLQHDKYGDIARDIYKLSLHPTQNFPFCVMGMNISRICLQSLREDIINKEINKRRNVMTSINDFYIGTYLHLYQLWKLGKTIADSGYVLREVETFAKKRTKDVFKNLEQYQLNGGKNVVKSEKGEDLFHSVC
ncbi:uncharacterized protein LOC126815690 isoform X2 [Patella vulgata]|uniref:uncharacterized protein LOC126815690 isoform X2 n=1 Tax=Patella vulgata TaxID=6465 RepID=UPI0021801C4B|nr:uncharacterized protein LOC126815690 isoform X2 [Patella vulgata]